MKSVKSLAPTKRRAQTAALLLPMLIGLNACGYVIHSATEDFSERLKQTVMEHNDPDTVAKALPSYLLMLEASTVDNADEELLLSTANLYGAYLSLSPNDPQIKQHLSQKSLNLALQGICAHDSRWCDLQRKTFDQLQALLQQAEDDDVDGLYSAATAWAAWIETHKSDWNAVAQLAQVKAIMQKILELNESYKQGNAHIYMAVLESLVPENLGGRPKLAQQHFQRAIELAPDNLMIKVLYAKHYARMVFDRDLHDTLLKSTLNAQTTAPSLTLINTLAQQQARQLLDSADDYF